MNEKDAKIKKQEAFLNMKEKGMMDQEKELMDKSKRIFELSKQFKKHSTASKSPNRFIASKTPRAFGMHQPSIQKSYSSKAEM